MNDIYKFQAKVEKVIFSKEDSSYHIFLFSTSEELPYTNFDITQGYIGTLVGNCIPITEQDLILVEAKVIKNNKYGEQFEIISLKRDQPRSEKTMITFLSNIISADKAKVLYQNYPDIVDIIDANPKFEPDYTKLKGIGEKTWIRIRDKILDNVCYAELIELLAPIGVSLTIIKKIAGRNKNIPLLKKQIIENPYILCKYKGLGFKKVDQYALKLNPTLVHSKFRTTEGIKYLLDDCANNEGHCYVNNQDFIKMFNVLLPNCKDILKEILLEQKTLTDLGKYKEAWLYVQNNQIGLMKYFLIEKSLFDNLCRLDNEKNLWNITYGEFFKQLDIVEKKQGFKLDEIQLDAVRSVAEHNVTIISGKAGCGKSSILKAILEVYQNHSVAMCALSAKAAKRMRETSGFQNASTIHRLLGLLTSKDSVEKDDENNLQGEKLTADLLIIDEVSMVNSSLLNICLQACKNGTKVVLVGDRAQLPSIGVGKALGDLLDYPVFNVHMLSKIYRQSEDSFIALHANVIRDGILPFDINQSILTFGKDAKYWFKNDSEDILQAILKIYIGYIQRGISFEDISIIIPRKEKTTISCRNVNEKIMALLLQNENRKIVCGDQKEFKVGCRVLNKVNDYDKGILNGDTGTVVDIMLKKNSYQVFVKFDDYEDLKTFTPAEMNNLELGYAITCHSSQGSQYKICIVALDFGSYSLLSSNLIYTAITRAKDNLIVIAEPRAFSKAVTNVTENNRNTFLSELLNNQLQINEKENIQVQQNEIINNNLDEREIKVIDFQ